MQSSAHSQKKSLSFREKISLSLYSSLGIGGDAKYLVEVHTKSDAIEALAFAKEKGVPFFVVGRGSNCLFHDRGFCGLIIVNKIQTISYQEDRVCVGGGYNFSLLGAQTARKGLAGLEFASGIPGSVGGAVFMNAGAGGVETKDSLVEVVYLDENGEEHLYYRDELEFSYRFSSFQEMSGMIIGATFCLVSDENARARQLEIVGYRTSTQPYSDKSAGCIFRNPEEGSAGSLIEASGLKGRQVGGAEVSTVHANFLINRKNATAKEFAELISEVQDEVFTQQGKKLKLEVREIPYDISR
jgi:UDP-N-acetylmuramate dehydrogenase